MDSQAPLGKQGEDVAAKYLVENRYRIIGRNVWQPWGELDIIARARDGTLVFVEVKTMREHEDLKPEDNLTRAKLVKFRRAASLYAGAKPELISAAGWRMDLIAVTLTGEAKAEDAAGKVLRHYENVAW